MKNVHNETKKLFSRALEMNPKEITENLHIDNISNWDSLAHLRLIMEIESNFNVQLKPSEIQSILDYQSVYSIVDRLINK